MRSGTVHLRRGRRRRTLGAILLVVGIFMLVRRLISCGFSMRRLPRLPTLPELPHPPSLPTLPSLPSPPTAPISLEGVLAIVAGIMILIGAILVISYFHSRTTEAAEGVPGSGPEADFSPDR